MDAVSIGTCIPLSFTFRKQPTNGDNTGTWLCFVVPEWRRGKGKMKHFFDVTICNTNTFVEEEDDVKMILSLKDYDRYMTDLPPT